MHEQAPILSVIITLVGGESALSRCLNRLSAQIGERPIEVIVPFDRTAGDLASLRAEYPRVVWLNEGALPTRGRPGSPGAMHELYDRRRSVGLRAARGAIVAMLEDTMIPAADWCDQVIEAHCLPHGVIGGAVDHGGHGALNWALYFLDFGRYQPPLPEGTASYLTDVNVSYKREVLASVRELWEERYHEVTVHWALARHGVVLWRRPQIVVSQDRGPLRLSSAISERVVWGRLFATLRTRELSVAARLSYALLCPALPLVLLGRAFRNVMAKGRHRLHFLGALPGTVLLATAWCLGECIGYLRASRA